MDQQRGDADVGATSQLRRHQPSRSGRIAAPAVFGKDRLSQGRFELGLGAGHTPQEYTATGIRFGEPRQRKARLLESVEVVRRLIAGEVVTYHGEHLHIDEAQIGASHQQRLPILVGGNGAALLGHAGAQADIIGLQGLGRTRPDGHRHAAKWDPLRLTAQIDQVRAGAGDRFDDLELNTLVQVTRITDDRTAALAQICERVEGLTIEHADAIPYLLVGTVDEIVDKARDVPRTLENLLLRRPRTGPLRTGDRRPSAMRGAPAPPCDASAPIGPLRRRVMQIGKAWRPRLVLGQSTIWR